MEEKDEAAVDVYTPLNPPSKEGGRHMGQEGREKQPSKTAPFGKGKTTPVPHFSEKVGDTPFTKGDMPNFSAWQMAWELGYTIAIPIVALALVGRWGDRMLGTTPWLLLVGVLLSIIISSFMVYRKVKDILK